MTTSQHRTIRSNGLRSTADEINLAMMKLITFMREMDQKDRETGLCMDKTTKHPYVHVVMVSDLLSHHEGYIYSVESSKVIAELKAREQSGWMETWIVDGSEVDKQYDHRGLCKDMDRRDISQSTNPMFGGL